MQSDGCQIKVNIEFADDEKSALLEQDVILKEEIEALTKNL